MSPGQNPAREQDVLLAAGREQVPRERGRGWGTEGKKFYLFGGFKKVSSCCYHGMICLPWLLPIQKHYSVHDCCCYCPEGPPLIPLLSWCPGLMSCLPLQILLLLMSCNKKLCIWRPNGHLHFDHFSSKLLSFKWFLTKILGLDLPKGPQKFHSKFWWPTLWSFYTVLIMSTT